MLFAKDIHDIGCVFLVEYTELVNSLSSSLVVDVTVRIVAVHVCRVTGLDWFARSVGLRSFVNLSY